jgi:ferredoxin
MSQRPVRQKTRALNIARRCVQIAFLALFAVLVFKAAYPPLQTPPSNALLRLDPLAGVYSVIASRSAEILASFWPAWVLLGLTALSSRFFCGWLCPLGTCFDAAGALKPKVLKYYKPKGKYMKRLLGLEERGATPRRIRLKYLILAVVLGLGLAGVNLLYFGSPLVVMNRSIYYILLPQVPFFLLFLLLLAFVYRPRFWCEELCPMGALMSLVSMATKRLSAVFSPLSVVKDADACIDCGACFKECDFGVAEPYLKRDSGKLRSADCTACGDCVSVCPAGGALKLESFGGTLYGSRGVREKKSDAVVGAGMEPAGESGHGRFTVTRREFVGSVSLGAVLLAGYGVGLRDLPGPVLRMPGAQNESEFLAACSRCGECVRTCPVGCIKPMGLEGGFQKLVTPRFYPRTAGCIFDQCDQACARVCPVSAIERQKPEDVKIGVAGVNKRTCLGWKGKPCLVCQERCRFNAIEANGLRPSILKDKCTGCGACEETCPTEPTSIRVFELGDPNAWPSDGGGRRRRGGS